MRKLIPVIYSQEGLQRLEEERLAILTICKGENCNLIAVLKVGQFQSPGFLFIDMVLCEFSLHNYIHKDSNIGVANKVLSQLEVSQSTVCDIMQQIVEGVEFIHRQPAVHRNIKPTNGMTEYEYEG